MPSPVSTPIILRSESKNSFRLGLRSSLFAGPGVGALRYAIFATYDIIDNYNAAKTGFNETDEAKILKALWHGTKNLTTRSKIGQTPRFMLIITYKDDTFAGDLNNSISLKSEKEDRAIRSINEYTIVTFTEPRPVTLTAMSTAEM